MSTRRMPCSALPSPPRLRPCACAQCKLPQLHAAALLHSLRARYEGGGYFSSLGGDLLLFVNPCAPLPDLWSEARLAAAAAAAAAACSAGAAHACAYLQHAPARHPHTHSVRRAGQSQFDAPRLVYWQTALTTPKETMT